MDVWESDAWAKEILHLARMPDDTFIRASDLAEALPGMCGVYQSKGLRLAGDAALARWNGSWYVAVRSGISMERGRFAVFHECAEYVFAIRGVHHPEKESACNAIAASLAMPRMPFLQSLKTYGENIEAVARCWKVTETSAALRIGEVTGRPLAAISPAQIRYRGDEFIWPIEKVLRSGTHPGLKKISLEPRRFALVAK